MKNITTDNIDYAESLSKLMDTIYVRYRGALIESINKQFLVHHLRKSFPTLHDAKKAIDASFKYLQNSIK